MGSKRRLIPDDVSAASGSLGKLDVALDQSCMYAPKAFEFASIPTPMYCTQHPQYHTEVSTPG